jgi:hypothetical protein
MTDENELTLTLEQIGQEMVSFIDKHALMKFEPGTSHFKFQQEVIKIAARYRLSLKNKEQK